MAAEQPDPRPPDPNLERFGGPITFEGPTPETVRCRLGLPRGLTGEQLAASFRLAQQRGQLYPLEIEVLRERGMLG
jgi:hypothetical protein